MTIMLAGGMAIAAPGMEPVHAANANLFVSTSTFGGPMVVEIIINDESYKDDDLESMPAVTIDGNDLVMTQGSDGNWYAYVADTNMAGYADGNTLGIDFGFLEDDPNIDMYTSAGGPSFDSSSEVYSIGDSDEGTVVKGSKSITKFTGTINNGLGQINLNEDKWPFIQTFEFTDDSDIKVVYEASKAQTEVIVYTEDMEDFASFSTDRTSYPHTADIHLVIDDMQLNIDPTDEDVWTFDIQNDISYYGIDSTIAINSVDQNKLFYGDNGFLVIDAKDVIEFQRNDDSNVNFADGASYVTVEETSPNTGLFENTDSANKANLITTSENIRDDSGIMEYNDKKSSLLISYFGGSILMDKATIDGEWSSGEELTVTITDQDENKNTKIQDIFDVADSKFQAIPAIRIGDPITLDGDTTLALSDGSTIADLEAANVVLQAEIDTANEKLDDLELDESDKDGEVFAQQVIVDAAFVLLQQDFTNTVNAQAYSDATDLLLILQDELSDIEDAIEVQDGIVDTKSDQITTNLIAISNDLPGSPITVTTTDEFSSRLIVSPSSLGSGEKLIVYYNGYTIADLQDFIEDTNVHSFVNYDVSSFERSNVVVSVSDGTDSVQLATGDEGYDLIDSTAIAAIELLDDTERLTVDIDFTDSTIPDGDYPLVIDFMRYAGEDGRINDAIYRYEAEETSDGSGVFTGTVEYVMLNQISIFDVSTFDDLETIGDELTIIVHEDLTEEDAVELIYYDLDKQGINTQVSDQMNAYTASGKVSFDSKSYKVADTVTVTIEDNDLNTNSDLVDIYTVAEDTNTIADPLFPTESILFEITFDDNRWEKLGCDVDKDGLYTSMSSIIETDESSGVFTGTFQIPQEYCTSSTTSESVTGLDLAVNYFDFRDASGEVIEVGDSSGIRAHTGSISLDRTVYPVPWGIVEHSKFPLHATAAGDENLPQGDLTIHVRVNDPDYDLSASGEDKIADGTVGPVKITVSRGGSDLILATAGANTTATIGGILELGPITEIAPDAGIFELDMTIKYDDGPSTSVCPDTSTGCILQGDILQVEYTDPTDASGSPNTITDSATFDLRNGVLQSDKSIYLIGSDMILTLIEPDFDLDNDQAESYDLDLIEWDSDADQLTMGNLGGQSGSFDPEPSSFRETGDSTGIFQIVIEIPDALDGDRLERGEEIQLEYTDWGPSGADYVGDEDEDVQLTIFTSNFGATIELDQKVYTWTDKVYITVVAPDLNFDDNLIDEIGTTDDDNLTVSTRTNDIDNYKLVETGVDTGIFTGEIILTGFSHDADGDGSTGDATTGYDTNPTTSGSGPTNGFLESGDDDGLTVSFEFSDGDIALGSALIRWNIGEVQFLEASYPASGTGVVRVIDPDMNLDPEAVDNFDIDIWSDSDAGGIDLTVTETNEATGIFEGTVFFTATDQSSGHRLRVAEGDTVTAEYEDNTLPDPYTTADELDVSATTLIGTIVPPLERAPAANLRTVDAFGNSLNTVTVDQQVQISADLSNGQDRIQKFAYLVQIQNGDGVTVSLAWITGSLTEGQQFSPALSWIPEESGSYTATAFVWESVDNPTALSPPVSTTITVS
jgi:hypothetical protein